MSPNGPKLIGVALAATALVAGVACWRAAPTPRPATKKGGSHLAYPRKKPVKGAFAPPRRQMRPALATTLEPIVWRLAELPGGDQRALEALFQEAAVAVQGRPAELDEFVSRAIPSLENGSVKRAFFLFKVLLDHGPSDPAALHRLLGAPVRPTDPHHAESVVLLTKIFVLSRLGPQPMDARAQERLRAELFAIAKHDRSLAVAAEALEALVRARLVAEPEAALAEIKAARRPRERFAFTLPPGV